MSFDGDSVSRYYSAMSGAQTPASQLRALVRTYPSALVGYSGGVDSALLAVVLRQELGRERMLAGVGRSASYPAAQWRSEEHTSELQSHSDLVCRLLLEKKKHKGRERSPQRSQT